MSLTQQKLNLIKKIVDNRLTKEELKQVTAKAEEILQRRTEKKVQQ